MIINISMLPSARNSEARHIMRDEIGAAGFDVRTLMKTKMVDSTPGLTEAAIEGKPQPDTNEELGSDNGQVPSTELHQFLVQQQPLPEPRSHAANLSTSSELNPPSPPLRSSLPEDAVRARAYPQLPTEQLAPKAGSGVVEQVAVKADSTAASNRTPAIADVLPKTKHVNQLSAVAISGAAPKPGAISLHSVTAISGQFAQTVTVLPPVVPTALAQDKDDLASLNEVASRSDAESATGVKSGARPETARVTSIGDRPGAQPSIHQLSGGNVQTAGVELSPVFATPERQMVDAIADEVSSLGARLKAQGMLAAENTAIGKLPLISQIRVDLNPASLGAVRIEIAMSATGEVELHFATAKETTAAMIERGREEVLGGLQSRAVDVRGFTVNAAEMGNGTQNGSPQEGSAARSAGHGDGQQSRHLLHGRRDGDANDTGQEKIMVDGEAAQQTVRNSGSGIYI